MDVMRRTVQEQACSIIDHNVASVAAEVLTSSLHWMLELPFPFAACYGDIEPETSVFQTRR